MCTSCGCGESAGGAIIRRPGHNGKHIHANHSHHEDHNHDHSHEDHDHHHHHENTHQSTHEIRIEQDVLQKNNQLAERNRGFFEAKDIIALNVVSSPGSGKTSFLEKTIRDLKEEYAFYVIEGDQQTMNDAERIEATGAEVVQVNTGSGCHLDASMINKAAKNLEITHNSILFIENVGNLVCPSLFDLGESRRIVLMSVTEGEDKPAKYPGIFEQSDIFIINKIDLIPHIEFDIEKTKDYARQVNPQIEIFETSVTKGDGMTDWYQRLKKGL